jgi:GAF domain-containing protein
LPSSKQRLIRASIIDNGARRQADTLAYGERRVLELVAANAPIEKTLSSVVRLVEQLHPGVGAAISVLDAAAGELRLVASHGLSPAMAETLAQLPLGLRSGSCGVAASLGRQVVVRDVATDPLWAELTSVAIAAGVRACCSTPIVTASDRVHGTLALYFGPCAARIRKSSTSLRA